MFCYVCYVFGPALDSCMNCYFYSQLSFWRWWFSFCAGQKFLYAGKTLILQSVQIVLKCMPASSTAVQWMMGGWMDGWMHVMTYTYSQMVNLSMPQYCCWIGCMRHHKLSLIGSFQIKCWNVFLLCCNVLIEFWLVMCCVAYLGPLALDCSQKYFSSLFPQTLIDCRSQGSVCIGHHKWNGCCDTDHKLARQSGGDIRTAVVRWMCLAINSVAVSSGCTPWPDAGICFLGQHWFSVSTKNTIYPQSPVFDA